MLWGRLGRGVGGETRNRDGGPSPPLLLASEQLMRFKRSAGGAGAFQFQLGPAQPSYKDPIPLSDLQGGEQGLMGRSFCLCPSPCPCAQPHLPSLLASTHKQEDKSETEQAGEDTEAEHSSSCVALLTCPVLWCSSRVAKSGLVEPEEGRVWGEEELQ